MDTPFRKIRSRDGKELNLFTGLYYHLSVKSIPNGIMTFEAEPREESNLIQLALNDLQDYDIEMSEENEVIEGPLATQALWTILPEVGSKENDYQFKVISHPEGKLTYTHGGSWGGRYMELDLKSPENYNPGATMYVSSLWYFRSCEFPDYFTVHNSDPRREPNYVTFSNESSDRGQLMQLGTKDLENYSPRGVFRNDALWHFRPKCYQIHAFVTNFVFEEPTPEELAEEAYPLRLAEDVLEFSGTNTTAKVDLSCPLWDTFKLNFMQSFKAFPEQNIKIDEKFFNGKNCLSFLQSKEPLTFTKKYGSNTQFIHEIEKSYAIQQELKCPNEDETPPKLAVTGYCSFIKDFEIPFKAIVEVTATTDHADPNTGLRIPRTAITSTEVLQYLLKYDKFTGKIVPNPNKKSKAQQRIGRFMKPTAPSSETQPEKGQEGVIFCEVSGRLKFTCGLDTYLDVKALE